MTNTNTTRKNIIDIFEERRQRRAAEKNALCTPLQDGESHIPLLKPGTLATQSVGSDSYPYEVIDSTYFTSGKKKGLVKTVTIRPLSSTAISGDYYAQTLKYKFESNPENKLVVAKAWYRKNGEFRCIAEFKYSGGCVCGTVEFGVAKKSLDPHL
jgi:hypothetical protein